MGRRRSQSGQALVAALVTTAILFALAGGLAVAVSAALGTQGPSTTTYLRDSEASSTTAAVLSRVAGAAGAVGGCPTGGLFGDVPGTAYGCHEVDLVSPGQVADVPLQWSGTCASGRLPGGGHVAAWLNTVAPLRAGASFYIDGSPSGCTPGRGACVATASSSGPGRFYLVSDCALGGFATPFAHVAAASPSVSVLRVAVLVSYLQGPAIALDPGVAPVVAARLRGAGAPVDLVVGNRRTGTVAVLLGVGDGTFAPPAVYRLAGDVSALTVADLGSGHLDIAATSFLRSSVTVLSGAGDGTFRTGPEIRLKPDALLGPVGIAAGSLLPGGKRALATANFLDRSVTILAAGGDGVFAPLRTDGVGDSAVAVASLDFGAAGTYLGVAKTEGGDGEVATYRVQGSGDLRSAGSFPVGGVPGALAVGSFAGGPGPDLAVSLPALGQVQVLLAQGSGQFQVVGATTAVGPSPTAVAAVNVDGRARSGLAVTGAGGSLSVFVSNGDGTFHPVAGGALATGAGPAGVAAGDLDGGGSDGLAVAAADAGAVDIFLPNRSRLFSVLAAAADGSAYNEADLLWADRSRTDSLLYEGGLR